MQERRHFPRLVAAVDVEYKVLPEGARPQTETVTKNIGAGGICLIVYEKVEVGRILNLKLHLPDTNLVVQAKGKVLWSSYFTMERDARDRYDLGIEFTEISESDQQKLSLYIFKLINPDKR
ncbi:MAG: PilZ domain-containing protein [Candidatus Omnitrophica bacterium]|nr:PilZ domain-containing protein [Candidatus Omnitrophota bacterium]